MTPHDLHPEPPFPDEDAHGDADVVRFATDGLVPALERLRNAPTLPHLQQATNELKEALRDPQHPIHARDDERSFVEFSRTYFSAELAQIATALSMERGVYYVERLLKGVTQARTSPINNINLNRWKEYDDILTDSLWMVDRRDSSGVHTAGYWGNFIPQIPNQMMRRYTKPGEWVLDPFAGSGTTLIEGQRLGRNTLGVELQRRMVDHAKQLVSAEPNIHQAVIDVVEGDSTTMDYRDLLANYGQTSVQLVLMHPPYYDIIKFSDDERDLSNAASVEAFLAMMGSLIEHTSTVLDKGRYLVIVIGDKYAKGDWIPLGFQTMNEALKRGFSLKSIIVKNFEDTSGKRNQKELWRYRALAGGFYIFKHEYLFLLRKQ